jgi:pimeloyl-ACP methyl ester carboxylesterase
MPEIRNDGVRISYDVAGEGWPLVLLHGWCCDRSWWTEPGYVEELRRDHLLVVVDLRGHGASDTYGGWTAWMTAAAAPERISAMVSSASWDPRPLHEEPTEPDEWDEAVRNGGTSALVACSRTRTGAAARAAVQQARGFPTLATPGPALIA